MGPGHDVAVDHADGGQGENGEQREGDEAHGQGGELVTFVGHDVGRSEPSLADSLRFGLPHETGPSVELIAAEG